MKEYSFLKVFCLTLQVFFGTVTFAEEKKETTPLAPPSLDLGQQTSYAGSNSTPLTRSLFYAEPGWKPSFDVGGIAFESNLKLRAWVDTLPGGFQSELSVRAASISTTQKSWRLVGGFQEIVWGETFGYPILDIVSPRDYRDPLLLDANWVRLPTASLNAQYFLGPTTLQLVVTPFARSPLFPSPGSPIDPTVGSTVLGLSATSGTDLSQFGASSEYGGKVSHLFTSGIDLGLIYYHHWNRNPVYKITPSGSATPPFNVSPVEQKVDTLGGTLSASLDHWVLRADQAVHLNQPLQNGGLGSLENGTQWQSVLGTDYTSDDGWTAGLQVQTTVDFFATTTRSFKWLSSRANKKFFNDHLEADLFVLVGLDNPDLWFQPKITWNLGEAWSLSLRADWIGYRGGSPSQGYLWIVRDQSRVFSWITFRI